MGYWYNHNAEAEEYYRTPWSIKQELLSVMTNSDIAEIIWDKRKEWGYIEWEKKIWIKPYRWEGRQIIEMFYLDEQNEINRLIKELQYILKSRDVWWWDWFNSEDLQKAKDNISIIDVVQILTWIKVHNTFHLIKCPFPDHKDWTASMKIYKNTNTFYCQWCKRWGSQIDFIKHLTQCSLSDAIKSFLTLYKK